MDWSPLLQPQVLTPSGLLAIAVLMMCLGKLVPYVFIKGYLAEIAHLRENNERLTAAVERIADSQEAAINTGEIVATVMRQLQVEAQKEKPR